MLYSSLPAPPSKTIFTRPHPIVWRCVNGLVICYFMALVFLSFHTVDDARWLITYTLIPQLSTRTIDEARWLDLSLSAS